MSVCLSLSLHSTDDDNNSTDAAALPCYYIM
jgi:hypothetical protein